MGRLLIVLGAVLAVVLLARTEAAPTSTTTVYLPRVVSIASSSWPTLTSTNTRTPTATATPTATPTTTATATPAATVTPTPTAYGCTTLATSPATLGPNWYAQWGPFAFQGHRVIVTAASPPGQPWSQLMILAQNDTSPASSYYTATDTLDLTIPITGTIPNHYVLQDANVSLVTETVTLQEWTCQG